MVSSVVLLSAATVTTHQNKARRRCAVQALRPTDASSTSMQIEALEREASQLRADVKKLEVEQAEQRLLEQNRLFSIFDINGSGIGIQELQHGMRELNGIELDEATAEQILEAHDEDKDGVLQFHEFNFEGLETTLAHIQEEAWGEEVEARRAAREKRERKEMEQELENAIRKFEEKLPPGNYDTGFLTRIGSAATYMIPILHWIVAVAPLIATHFPATQELSATIANAVQMSPLEHFLVFLTMVAVSWNTDLPKLLRFNLRQAALLDAGIWYFAFVVNGFVAYIAPWSDPVDLLDPTLTGWAIMLVACFAYSIICCLAGKIVPNGIPFVSEFASSTMTPTRPDSKWAMEKQDLINDPRRRG